VFVDECGINTTLHRRYARAQQGQRAEGVVPRNWKENTTVIGAIGTTGLQAVMTFEGALDRSAFEAFVEQILVPTLHAGQIVIMDNLSAHKSAQARQRVEAAGCRWEFLPAYSPDFNPIEQLWSKFKSDLRREAARTQPALDQSIWPLLSTVTPQHAHNWFKNCGYMSHYS
jgi:transposase